MSTFAVSDLHGCYDIWKQIEDYLLPDDTLYVLGDVIDREPNGFVIYEEMIYYDNIHIIKGNHEAMAEDALKEILSGVKDTPVKDLWFCDENGGRESWMSIKDCDPEYWRIFADFFSMLPDHYEYKNIHGQYIYLDHCGFTPNRKYYPYEDRNHFKHSYRAKDWKNWEDVIIVHGHTPVDIMCTYFGYYTNEDINTLNPLANKKDHTEDIKEMIRYCNGHKINIDMGLPWSNICCMLDLDSLQPIYFERGKEYAE